MPSIRGMMKAKKAEIGTMTLADIEGDEQKAGLKGSPTQVVKIFSPPPKGGGEILEGETADVVAKLVSKIKERKII